jgi:hypothetical protein
MSTDNNWQDPSVDPGDIDGEGLRATTEGASRAEEREALPDADARWVPVDDEDTQIELGYN